MYSEIQIFKDLIILCPVLSVRFEVGVSLLLALAEADKRGPFSFSGLCRNTAGYSLERTRRSSGGSRVLLKVLCASQ